MEISKSKSKSNRSGGFTLVEALLAATILAIAVTAVLMPFTAAARNGQVEGRLTAAVGLAEEIMEEILSKPYRDPDGNSNPGPESGEWDRADFDNIDDYHGYSQMEGEITDLTGVAATDATTQGLTRQVNVEYVYVSGQDVAQPPTFLSVEVTVQYEYSPLITLKRLVYDR